MPEENDKNIRIPVTGEEGRHTDHKIRVMVINSDEGVKGLYCVEEKIFIAYVFAKNKGWDVVKAKNWSLDFEKKYVKYEELDVDQEPEFVKLNCLLPNGDVDVLLPKSAAFIMTEAIMDFTTGMDDLYESGEPVDIEKWDKAGKYLRARIISPDEFDNKTFRIIDIDAAAGIRAIVGRMKNKQAMTTQAYLFEVDKWTTAEAKAWLKDHDIEWILFDESAEEKNLGEKKGADDMPNENEMMFIKVDKEKRLAYGVFLVPDKADHDGDVISVDDVEKVAHGFMKDYRTIDEMHDEVITASIVESAIAWQDDLDFQGKKLKKGTWFGVIKINDNDVWDKVVAGVYQGFSVRIAGTREPIEEGK